MLMSPSSGKVYVTFTCRGQTKSSKTAIADILKTQPMK